MVDKAFEKMTQGGQDSNNYEKDMCIHMENATNITKPQTGRKY